MCPRCEENRRIGKARDFILKNKMCYSCKTGVKRNSNGRYNNTKSQFGDTYP